MAERLIDAEALKTKIQKIKAEALEHGFAPESVCGDILLNFLDNAPIIEAKPVVHAHWEEVREGRHICSNCKVKASLTSDEYDYMEDLSDYCPHCGARMDEVVVEENATTTNNTQKVSVDGVKIPVISMEDVPKLAKEMEK